ncbi:hypothetical protein ECAE60S_03174 [Eoetvoesiella caeni]
MATGVPISYSDALQAARSIGHALLDRRLSVDRPMLALSGNDIEHALLALGCQFAGVPYCPISPSCSTQPSTKLLTALSEVGLRHTSTMAVPVLYASATDTHESSNWKCHTVGQPKICPAVNLKLFTISVPRIASRYGSNSMNAVNFVRR